MTVKIDAPEGALPEGVSVVIEPVPAAQIEGAVKAEMGENAEVVKAVDITFYDKDGNKIEPKQPISVKFVSGEIKAADNASVLHIKDNGVAETADNGNVSGGTASFESKEFSIYAVVDEGSENNSRLKVIFKSGDSEIASVNYTVNQAFVPGGDEDFHGWNAIDGGSNIAGHTEGKVYPNGTEITISGNVVFSVDVAAGHWLVFHENGTGGTYNAPQFVEAGEGTKEEYLPMTRKGYTFGGWYTNAACTEGNEFTFGSTLSETTHIYAKWNPATTAGYTILIWKQNLSIMMNELLKMMYLSLEL